MIDPWKALNLAAAVVQFVDFGAEIISKATQIYRTGADLDTSRLETQVKDAKILARDLEMQQRLRDKLPADISPYDRRLITEPKSAGTFGIFGENRELKLAKQELKYAKTRQDLRNIEYSLRQRDENVKLHNETLQAKESDLRRMTDELFLMNNRLTAEERPDLLRASGMIEGPSELAKLVSDCVVVAEELIRLLSHFESNVRSRKWKSVHKALQAVWNQDKIERLARTLDSCRSALVLRILVALNEKSDLQAAVLDKNFEDLDRGNQEVVEVISINQSRLQSAVHHAYERSEAAAQHRHNQTIAAILTLRNGDSKLVARPGDDIGHTDLDRSSRSPKRFLTLRGGSEVAGQGSGSIVWKERRMASVEAQVLDCLHFRQIGDRKEEVSAAYRKPLNGFSRMMLCKGDPGTT